MNGKKTFITVISQQGVKSKSSELKALRYDSPDNVRLDYDSKIKFPITAAIHGYANSNDEVKVIAIIDRSNRNLMNNYNEYFKNEMERIREEMKIPTENFKIEEVDVSGFADKNIELELFEKVIEKIDYYEEIYVCITYGIKPIPIILFSVSNYLEKVKDCNIRIIIYGHVIREDGKDPIPEIRDITSLYVNNNILLRLSDLGINDPIKKVKELRKNQEAFMHDDEDEDYEE